MRPIFRALLFAFLAAALPARAENAVQPMPKPAEIEPAIKATAPFGEGSYDYFVMRIYEAALWTDAPAWSMNAPFALAMHYEIDIPQEKMIDGSLDEMDRPAPLSDADRAAYKAELGRLFPEIRKDDNVTLLFTPGKDLAFYHNGRLTGRSADLVFVQRYLNLWMTPGGSTDDLRRELLHEKSE